MSAAAQQESEDAVASAKAVAWSGGSLLLITLIKPVQPGTTRLALFVPVLVTVLSRIWSLIVTYYVPDPYLDEVFHIPQAQKFCEGRYQDWDDKITTPPGLYLIPPLIPEGFLLGALTGIHDCSTLSLRAFSALGLLAVVCLAMFCRATIEKIQHAEQSYTQLRFLSQYAVHTALNVALFPLLFFFSGLYYTDVVSTAVVLGVVLNCLLRLKSGSKGLISGVRTFILGIMALFMRQTNVFWAVVFCGGLEAVQAVKSLQPGRIEQPRNMTFMQRVKWFAWRWSIGDIHDPPVSSAWPDDMHFTAISLLVGGIWNLPRVLRQIWPYVLILFSFVAFVIWNQGVVLGDKSNHVATIHLAQMLYIWPLFTFFSLPLLLPHALSAVCFLRGFSPASSNKKQAKRPEEASLKDSKEPPMTLLSPKVIIWILYLLGTTTLSFAIVHFNTIIHPFTLADNRHYMFYIFRYTIRRAWWIKYVLVVPYTVSRWLLWGALQGFPSWSCMSKTTQVTPFINHPFKSNTISTSQSAATQRQKASDQKQKELEESLLKDPLQVSTMVFSTSTAMIFLVATSLSLITAPLVEPRYFIIPWVVWRLFLPAWRLPVGKNSSAPEAGSMYSRLQSTFASCDTRLFVETAWFVVINLVTGAIFLLKPYQWKAEDGTLLDGGRLQRFMW